MKSAATLMKNTMLLASSNIIMRLCALCFQAFIAAKTDARNLGVFGIISSVGAVFATISISGARFSVTRITAEELSFGNRHPRKFMNCAFIYALCCGGIAFAGLYFPADVISRCYVGNTEAVLPLRIMAFSMPAISLGSCIEGYFSAKQKVFRLIIMQLVSQFSRIGFVAAAFISCPISRTRPLDILAFGTALGEIVFAAGMGLLYFCESGKNSCGKMQKKYFSHLIKTAAPLAVSAYMRTGLSSLGQVLIPSGLKKSGMNTAGAFASYGVISQMALPVIMFPAAILAALGDVLVPRLTEAQMQNRKIGISYIVNRALRLGIMFSLGIMGVMFFFAEDMATAIYKNREAGNYIKVFAPLIPIIYVDCVTDGCLKGLGQQVHSMMYNVMEGILNVILLRCLLPEMALSGYILVMYIKESFNSVLSLKRLAKITAMDTKNKTMLTSLFCVLGALVISGISDITGILAVRIAAYCAFYVSLLYIVNAVSRDDIKWIISLVDAEKNKSLQMK